MEKNQPVVLTGLMGLMDPLHWRASTDWVTHNSQRNFQFFSTHFGASKVQEYPEYVAYVTPMFSSDDWLNPDLGLLFMLMFLGPIASKQILFCFSLQLVCMCVLAIWLECTEDAGEIIFVPSGWYHQFHNLEDTISINHNWFNAYNLSWVVN
ncbi:JmjC domain-containing protein 4 isoform B [Glycine soja]|uniref:JmjC domain-containing protein 4 isoform B n=1 Tax=Glycine soja TaxID=3848 RepID=A0A445KBD8_GLYSO|nr:JmjC domain-containing protein 4 isoform B [Glycine soja]